jgi:hypothetical protein
MKRMLLVGSVIAVLSLSLVFAIPALAHGPEDGETALADQDTWEVMHEACEEGDWEEMEKAAEEFHGEDFASMPCHDEGYDSSDGGWGGMGGHMDGGMMGYGWGGMM